MEIRGVTRCVIVAACLLPLAGPACADFIPHADPGCRTRDRLFDTELAAVTALGLCYRTISAREDREYIAAIVRLDTGYRFVLAAAARGHHRVTLRFVRHPGETLVALWHTHGAPGAHRHLFSPEDTALATATRLPFYLSDPGGALRVYRPGDRKRVRRDGSVVRPPRGSAPGTLVAAAAAASAVPRAGALAVR